MPLVLGHAILTDMWNYGKGSPSFTDSNQTGANPSVPWSSTINIGTASADRIIIVEASDLDSNTGRTINSVQINGVEMTALCTVGSGTTASSWLCALKVTTGTTATLKVDAGATNSLGAFVWALYGFPRGTWIKQDTVAISSGGPFTIDKPINGITFGGGVSAYVNGSAVVGTGITVDGTMVLSTATKRWGGHTTSPSKFNDYSSTISITNFTGSKNRNTFATLLPPVA